MSTFEDLGVVPRVWLKVLKGMIKNPFILYFFLAHQNAFVCCLGDGAASESPEKVEAPLELCGGRRKEAREIAWMGHKEEALG